MISLLDIPDRVLSKGLPFAIYSLPNKTKFTLVVQKSSVVSEIDILDIEEKSGFVVSTFESARTGISKIIKPDFLINEDDNLSDLNDFLSSIPEKPSKSTIDNISISKEDYLERANYLVNKLIDNELQKVVLSRVIKKHIDREIKISSLISLMRNKYKDAFINLFHIPGEGIWFGASPETLYKVIGDYVHTDALAGTKAIDEQNPNPKWTIKEKEEQYMVSLFIESLLSELGIKGYSLSGPITANAGNIAHLQSIFKIPTLSLKNNEGKFIAGLHPTPAVCGLPKAEAFLLIQKAEQHQRRYYSGFLGPWNLDDNNQINTKTSELFVNLRCAEMANNKINLYVGGGLTASSVPEDEYQETVHKSKTLLSIVENL